MTTTIISNADGSSSILNGVNEAMRITTGGLILPKIPICRMTNNGEWLTAGEQAMALPVAAINIGGMADIVNSKIIPTIPGIYRVTAFASAYHTNNIGYFYVNIFKNAVKYAYGNGVYPQSLSDEKESIASCLVSMNGTTDYLKLSITNGVSAYPVTQTTVYLEAEFVSLP